MYEIPQFSMAWYFKYTLVVLKYSSYLYRQDGDDLSRCHTMSHDKRKRKEEENRREQQVEAERDFKKHTACCSLSLSAAPACVVCVWMSNVCALLTSTKNKIRDPKYLCNNINMVTGYRYRPFWYRDQKR